MKSKTLRLVLFVVLALCVIGSLIYGIYAGDPHDMLVEGSKL